MSRPEGLPKTGGRLPGTPNKRTLELAAKLEEHGIDPLAEIAAALPDLTSERRIEVMLALLPFLFPKRKAIALAIETDEPSESRLIIDMGSTD